MNEKEPMIYAELTGSRLAAILKALDALENVREAIAGPCSDCEAEDELIGAIMDMCGFSDYYDIRPDEHTPRSLCLRVAHSLVCSYDDTPESRAARLIEIARCIGEGAS